MAPPGPIVPEPGVGSRKLPAPALRRTGGVPRDLESGDDNILRMTAIVDCDSCGCSWDQVWEAIGQEVQDLQEPPTAHCVCPECGAESDQEFPGFLQYGYE